MTSASYKKEWWEKNKARVNAVRRGEIAPRSEPVNLHNWMYNNKPKGERNGMAKLTVEAIQQIRASSLSCRKLARQYGMNHASIARIRNGEVWKHVA